MKQNIYNDCKDTDHYQVTTPSRADAVGGGQIIVWHAFIFRYLIAGYFTYVITGEPLEYVTCNGRASEYSIITEVSDPVHKHSVLQAPRIC